ncbi:MAG: CDP-glycerol glycerophosphotransferase family protein [Rhodothermaceae bacterium]
MKSDKRRIKQKLTNLITINVCRLLGLFVKKDKNLWVFGSRDGEYFADNSKYFYLYIFENHKEINPVWITGNKKIYDELTKDGYNVLLKNSFVAILTGIRAKVYIITHSLKDVVHCFKPNAIIVNLWHGMPIKQLLGDNRENLKYSVIRRIERKIIKWLTAVSLPGKEIDLFISTSESTKDNLQKSNGCPNIQITGQPRDDIFYRNIDKNSVLKKYGFEKFTEKTVITYMPTFRDHNKKYSSKFIEHKEQFKAFLDYNEDIIVIEKSHLQDSEEAVELKLEFGNYKNISDGNIDTQELLLMTDVLITDYSGVFIDFLHLNRPVIFYSYDLEEYLSSRGFFYDYYQIACGKIVNNFDDLLTAIKEYKTNSDLDLSKRKQAAELFYKYSDGNSSDRVFQQIKELL